MNIVNNNNDIKKIDRNRNVEGVWTLCDQNKHSDYPLFYCTQQTDGTKPDREQIKQDCHLPIF